MSTPSTPHLPQGSIRLDKDGRVKVGSAPQREAHPEAGGDARYKQPRGPPSCYSLIRKSWEPRAFLYRDPPPTTILVLTSVLYIYIYIYIYADGSICLDILQNRWSPTYDVSSILTSIHPANSQAAQLYQENKREYEKRVSAIVEQSWRDC
ncbi:unnamed protein product [Nyctereutes procyonoides]|uniref:(raccoon dog) hypothetical protein n=1 Tax=Nyctereutes procyonoides TaxID=34880 RepID=A0A811ZPA6_NYCPR|nr:unnamed protein product [Nyctereutes procyonoides]